VHYEQGFLCVLENLPKYSCTLAVATAVQTLNTDQLRLHGVITIERWNPQGNEAIDLWRDCRLAFPAEAEAVMIALMSDLRRELETALPTFDRVRGQA
jgi:hypothetical protein